MHDLFAIANLLVISLEELIENSFSIDMILNKLCGKPPHYAPCKFDLLIVKVVSESRVTWLPLCQF